MTAKTSSSQLLPHLVLRITLCFVLGCPVLPCLAHAEARQKTPTELDKAIAAVKSGNFSARDVVVIADAGAAVQVVPALKEQFKRATDVDTKIAIASGLVRLKDRDDTYAIYYNNITNTGTADCYLRDKIGKASTTGWLISSAVNSSGAIVGMAGSGQNPLSVPLGSIDWSMTTYIDAASSTGHVAYQHTCYPAHQVKVANTTLYLYTPPSNDASYGAECLTGFRPEVTGTSSTKSIH